MLSVRGPKQGARTQTPGQQSDIPIPITQLPAGKAYGADDIKNWSNRRKEGKSGVYDVKGIKKQRRRAKELSKVRGKRVKPWK